MKKRLMLVLAVQIDEQLAQTLQFPDIDELARNETPAPATRRDLPAHAQRLLAAPFQFPKLRSILLWIPLLTVSVSN